MEKKNPVTPDRPVWRTRANAQSSVSPLGKPIGRGRGVYLGNIVRGLDTDISPACAERVIGKCRASEKPPSIRELEKPSELERSVLVYGISDVDRTLLSLFFESERKCGGDDIENIDIHPDGDIALIQYKDATVAQQVISRGPEYKLGSYIMRVEQPLIPDPRSLQINGIHPRTSNETLLLYFENTKRSGGDDVDDIQYVEGSGKAIVTFKIAEVAKRVLQHKQLHLDGVSLSASSLSWKDLISCHSQVTRIDERIQSESLSSHPYEPNAESQVTKKTSSKLSSKHQFHGINTIQIVNIPLISEGYLKLILEENDHGKVDCITMSEEKKDAIVKFKYEQDAASLLQKGSIMIESTSCKLIPLYTAVHEKTEGSLAIKVRGLSQDIKQNLLDLYFNNRRKSGGYDVNSILMLPKNGEAVVTFHCAEAVKNVLGMQNKSCLRLKNTDIHVEEMKPLPPPPFIPEPNESTKLIMIGAPAVTRKELEAFLSGDMMKKCDESVSSTSVSITQILYGYQNRALLIEFQTTPDYSAMLAVCVSLPLKDQMTSLQKVALTTLIQVKANVTLDTEDLCLYFESEENGGGEIIDDIKLFHDGQCAVLDLGSPEVVDAVLKKKHTICGRRVEVDKFYPEFGTWPLDYNPQKPWQSIPSAFNFKVQDPLVIEFLSTKPEALDRFNEISQASAFSVNLVSACDTELHVTYTDDNSGIIPEQNQWEESSRDLLSQLCESIIVRNIAPTSECFNKILDKATKLVQEDGSILLKPLKDKSVMILIGWEKVISRISVVLEQFMDECKYQSKLTTDRMDLQSYEVAIIEEMNYISQLKQQFPKLSIKTMPKIVAFTGLPEEITKAKLFLYENVLREIKQEQCQLSERILTFLKNKTVRSVILSKCQKANVVVVFEYADKMVTLCAMSKRELQVAKDILQNTVLSKCMPLQESELPVLQLQQWTALKNRLMDSYQGKLLIEVDRKTRMIHVTTLYDICDAILEEIRNTLTEYAVLENTYNLDAPIMQLLSNFHQDLIRSITNNLQNQVDVQSGPHGYVFKGNKFGIEAAIQAFDVIYAKVVTKNHTIDQPVMAYYLRSNEGKEEIRLIEQACKAVCVDKNTLDTSGSMKSTTIPGSEELHTTLIWRTTVTVLLADMTRHRVDAIVNAANGDLKLLGGLAGAILKAGGQQIQKECDDYMRGKNTLLAGNVYVSKPGHLPCSIIIHAVGPRWKDGSSGEINELFEVVSRCMEETENAHLRSIAIPAISSGIFGFPIDKATAVICDAVVDFLKKNPGTCIREVHLMDTVRAHAQSFVQSLKNYEHQQLKISELLSASKPQSVSVKPKSLAGKMRAFFMGGSQSSNSKSGTDTIYTSQGISIMIRKGSLEQEQVDVLVNSTSTNFDLKSGKVSAAIVAAAGQTIQNECLAYLIAQGKVHCGDIVPTSGGNLSVTSIYHGYLCQWDGGKKLRYFISNALGAAHQSGFSSIAFPALGTGNLNYDPNTVAKIMVEEIQKFSSAFQPTSLKDVRIVLYPRDAATIKAFEDYWKSQTTTTPGSSTVRRIYKEEVVSSASQSQLYYIIQESSQMLAVQIGSVTVTLKTGNITNETTDVIMNNTDQAFSTQGAVSKVLAKVGGPTIRSECYAILNTVGGLADVALTNAGNLLCHKIIHVNMQSGEDWCALLLKMFKILEENKLKSLALPALGSGSLKKNTQKVCHCILRAISTFGLERNPKHLHNINIVLFDKGIFKDYKAEVQEIFKRNGGGILPKLTESSQNTSLTYRIYALSQAAADDCAAKLEALSRNKIQKHVFQDIEDQEIIGLLQPHHITMIKALEKEFNSCIEVYQGSRLNRIVVEADLKNLAHCVTKISKILHKVQAEHEEMENAKLIYKQVRWQFADVGGFSEYPPEINYIIEKAYSSQSNTATWKEDKGDVVVFLDRMIERTNNNPKTDAEVKRQVLNSQAGGSASLPGSWCPMPTGQSCIRVMLNANSVEFQQVAQKFTPGNIISIERIQNPDLYRLYEVRKEQMNKANNSSQNEMLLYHGTAETSIQNINNFGFNRSYCGKHGTAIGEGVYFAVNPTYSASSSYSRPNATGEKHIYQAKVLVGNSCLGHGGLKEPPYINGNSGPRYDSVHDKAKSMFVVFHDAQAYPEYLIKFR